MSMRDYGISDYGMVLNTNHLQMLAAQVCSDYSERCWEENKYEYAEYVCEHLGIEYISDFNGEAMLLLDSGADAWRDSELYSADAIYYVPLSRVPTLFGQAYQNIDEVIQEVKNKVGNYFPSDFNYKNNIRHIVGTYFE